MKKIMILLTLLSCMSFSYGQDTIFYESCGKTDVSSSKKVDLFTGWDNSSPVTFTRTITLDGYADVRITSSTSNHVWFPSDKCSDLIISKIPAAGYRNLKLSFDIAPYKLTDACVDKLKIFCNSTPLVLPATTLTSQKFISVTDIPLADSNSITLKFEYTAESNTNGYRLDNFTITGEKATNDIGNPSSSVFNPIISGNKLLIAGIPEGSVVVLYNSVGSILQTSVPDNRIITLNGNMTKGVYIVRIGNRSVKVLL